MWFSGRLISQFDHPNRAKDSWEREISYTKRDEEAKRGGGGTGGRDRRQKGRNRQRERKGVREMQKWLSSNKAQSGLIGHRYLERYESRSGQCRLFAD